MVPSPAPAAAGIVVLVDAPAEDVIFAVIWDNFVSSDFNAWAIISSGNPIRVILSLFKASSFSQLLAMAGED